MGSPKGDSLPEYPESLTYAIANYGDEGCPLSAHEVERLFEKFGPNSIETEKKHPCYMILLQSFLHPFNILLCIIAISSSLASAQDESGLDYSTTIIISAMILISTILRFYQEWKSEGAVHGLLQLITKSVSVVRMDPVEPIAREMTVPSEELVPGDWVILRPGEVVPADAVVLASKVFFVSQAPLTGEAIPVEKYSGKEKVLNNNGESSTGQNDAHSITDVEKSASPVEIHERVSKIRRFFRVIFGMKVTAESQLDKSSNLLREDLSSPENVFMGSQVISGMATVKILRIGPDTLFGRIAVALQRVQTVNPFQRGVKRISWLFFLTMALMVPPVFLIYGFTHSADKNRWMTAFLFSLSVAVGLTPEMLPMIVNANLAKGSMELSKKYSIVKKLDAIINLGAVDVICTDKTGTLTKSVIQLSSHVDPYGNISYIPFQIAFLNSYFQSVLQNPLDSAIVSFYDKITSPTTNIPDGESEHNSLPTERKAFLAADATVSVRKFSRIDELPFDFIRRRLSIVIKQSIHKGEDKVYLICKGAVEETLTICTKSVKDNVRLDSNDQVFPPESSITALDDKMREDLMKQYIVYTDRGERVLAVAYKLLHGEAKIIKNEDEKDMIFVGFISFTDPPKTTTNLAIADLIRHNIVVKVLTGDAANICATVCKKINLPIKQIVTGSDIDAAVKNDNLGEVVEQGTVFAKLTPLQKAQVVRALKECGNHVVGFIGDGINDAPALKEADVGISVENGVDICRKSADIILLDKDLNVVVDGIRIGRKTYGNTIKYIAMAVSSNFGNVFSVLVAAAWIPFEPMTSPQILTQNLLYDISQIAIPWDLMDEEFLYVPHKWKMKSILRFMVWMGPQSSIFDITTFAYMYITLDIHDKNKAKDENNQKEFQTTWFTVGLLTQTLIVHLIRTPKIPLFQSRASYQLTCLTLAVMVMGLAIPYIPFIKDRLKFSDMLPGNVYIFIGIVLCSYCVVATIAKLIYVKVFKECSNNLLALI